MTKFADAAREAARRPDGKFGEQVRAEDTTVDLVAARAPFATEEVRVTDLRIGDRVSLDGRTTCTVTSLDGDHKDVSIEFDDDETTIASYGLDERIERVTAPETGSDDAASRDLSVFTNHPTYATVATAPTDLMVGQMVNLFGTPREVTRIIDWDGKVLYVQFDDQPAVYHLHGGEPVQRLTEPAQFTCPDCGGVSSRLRAHTAHVREACLKGPERVAERFADDINKMGPREQRRFLERAGIHTAAEIRAAGRDGVYDILVEDAAREVASAAARGRGGREIAWAALNGE